MIVTTKSWVDWHELNSIAFILLGSGLSWGDCLAFLILDLAILVYKSATSLYKFFIGNPLKRMTLRVIITSVFTAIMAHLAHSFGNLLHPLCHCTDLL